MPRTARRAAARVAIRSGVVAAAVVAASALGAAAPALAGTTGQQVRECAHAMLPQDLGSDGTVSMSTPSGGTMTFRTFGQMVTEMRAQPMCS